MKMKKSKSSTVLGAILALLGIAQCVGVRLAFHACGQTEEGKWMACHWAEQAVFALGISLSVTAVMLLIIRNRAVKQGLALSMIPQAAVTAFIPNTLIKLCMMTDMRCHAVMKPAVIVIAAVTAIIAAVYVITGRKDISCGE